MISEIILILIVVMSAFSKLTAIKSRVTIVSLNTSMFAFRADNPPGSGKVNKQNKIRNKTFAFIQNFHDMLTTQRAHIMVAKE